ncbi:unnamed protein product [Peronospora belbahrii]|uniref:Protein kinase domain-containing protein n=1 Tax=Peronospora belbahrii TaxID=622444 RepID=A0AAU9KKC5_9STRA|nr:unnamed protein product [Peronospora belbahrii]
MPSTTLDNILPSPTQLSWNALRHRPQIVTASTVLTGQWTSLAQRTSTPHCILKAAWIHQNRPDRKLAYGKTKLSRQHVSQWKSSYARKKINEGGYGVVYRGLYRDESVAIKVLLPEKRRDMRQINTFLSEIKMMAAVEHPYIVRFIGVAWDALSDLCAVSEFMRGGDLFALLRRFDRVEHRVQGFDIDKAKIALHIAQALTYLHSLDPIVLHRDLKSMNILLSDDWEAKLTDFGVSRRWTVDTMTGGVGTRRWMAPEVMMGKRYDTSADIFSFGVVLSELDSHQPPYANAIASITTELGEKVTETALMEMVAMGRVRVDFSSSAPSLVVDLGHACVNLNPRLRPSASEVHYQLQKILRRYQKYTL